MNTKYPHIFEPLKIRNVTFKNRIWSGPASVSELEGCDKYPNDHVIAYYANKARGGAAVITYSAQYIDRNGLFQPPLNILDKSTHSHWIQLTNAIHAHGAKASLEMISFTYTFQDENGEYKPFTVSGSNAGALAVNSETRSRANSLMLQREHFEKIAQDYADAAEAALACGFDMILVHGGHGLPLFNILSPKYNTRTDEFGGSLENRMKWPLMVLKAIRDRVGDKLIIEYRISGTENLGDEGFQIDDCIAVIKELQKYIDIAHISAGSMSARTDYITMPNNHLKEGNNAYLAAAVKKCPDIHIPVLTLGAFQDPALVEKTLANGEADIVCMVRGLIADADAVNKTQEGREDEIIPCIRCLHCFDTADSQRPGNANTFSCSVNPNTGREFLHSLMLKPASSKKKVVIIGGGPAGMQAAITARQRGHEVILLEKADHLGGKLVFSQQVPFKSRLACFMNYQIHMVEKLGVDVRLNTEATPELVESFAPDAVIAALGAQPVRPPIPGLDGPNVMTGPECYENAQTLQGERIVLLGGGLVGCETGLYLSEVLHKKVTLLEMKDKLAEAEHPTYWDDLMRRLNENMTCHTNARCTEITENGVAYVDENGNSQFEPADLVVAAMGMRALSAEAEKFRHTANYFRSIGDCVAATNVMNATRTGFDAVAYL